MRNKRGFKILSRICRLALAFTFIFSGFTKVDRKSTRLNSSHVSISYAVFCLKKKNKKEDKENIIDRKSTRQSMYELIM